LGSDTISAYDLAPLSFAEDLHLDHGARADNAGCSIAKIALAGY
jgi:hypothetical protein